MFVSHPQSTSYSHCKVCRRCSALDTIETHLPWTSWQLFPISGYSQIQRSYNLLLHKDGLSHNLRHTTCCDGHCILCWLEHILWAMKAKNIPLCCTTVDENSINPKSNILLTSPISQTCFNSDWPVLEEKHKTKHNNTVIGSCLMGIDVYLYHPVIDCINEYFNSLRIVFRQRKMQGLGRCAVHKIISGNTSENPQTSWYKMGCICRQWLIGIQLPEVCLCLHTITQPPSFRKVDKRRMDHAINPRVR